MSAVNLRALMGPAGCIVEHRGIDQMGIADGIGALRLESGRSELELANELGLTVDGHCVTMTRIHVRQTHAAFRL
jgi:hypothetical protein